MLRLLIQFADDGFADFRWASFDETMDSGTLNWRQAGADELSSVTAQNPDPVIIDARKQVPTKYVIATLNEVVRAGIQDVTFAAPEIPY